MNKKALLQITKKLDGIEYAFISGFAVEILTNGKRKAEDVDIVVLPGNIDEIARRFNCKVEERTVSKGDWKDVKDRSFRTICEGQNVEVVTDISKAEGIKRLLKNKVKRIYHGVEVYITPVEELVVHKASMMREKDISDLKLLSGNNINLKLLRELSKNRIEYDKLIKILEEFKFDLS